MKNSSKLTIVVLILGVLTSLEAFATNYNSCRHTQLVDVRGNSKIDGILGDGKDGKVTIAEVAVANPLDNLDRLVAAVLAADPGVLEALSDPEAELTVFAPDNDAFDAIPDSILNALDSELLTDTLLYHVLAGYFDPRRVFYIRAVDSLLSQDLFVKRGRKNPTVNQSNIECAGVRTDNGLVWLIDSVLQPQY